ncbi:MAG TPA: glycerophosphodiester phosphodiesterase family protein [Patescibacteria group bacterium]|nr:glycerophosphodiester phosphodiesterase family protein [Patescibacteria group bacterium]
MSQIKAIKKPHLFAHRGGNQSGREFENTIKAFSTAVELGYRFLETDVIVTKDSKVVCYHGSLTWGDKRISGLEVRRKLQKLTYSQIKQKAASKEYEMPLLEEVLRKFPRICFSIDVKTKEVVEPVVKVIKKVKAEERVIVTSFSLKRSIRANSLLRGDEIQAALCISRISLWIITPFNRLFLPYLKARGIAYLEVSYRRVNKSLISLAHSQGIFVYAWTVNDAKDMERLLQLGIDGIMSDQTKLLLQTVKKQKA